MTFRKRVYHFLESEKTEKTLGERIFEISLIAIITLNIVAIVIESIPGIRDRYDVYFRNLELVSIIFFTIEYIARIYAAVENPRFKHPIIGRLKYAITPLALVDLLAILPFYIAYFGYLRFIRIFRLMALFRLFKIARYLHALSIFRNVLTQRKEQLVLSFLFILFVLVILSFFMFYVENAAQPDKFSSIPAAMWWGVATLTTVGYGDIVPITPLGKVFGSVFAIAGVGLLALPAGILSSGFFELLHSNKTEAKEMKRCPHCGGDLH